MQEIREINKISDFGVKVNDLMGKQDLDNAGKDVGKIRGIRINPKTFALDGIEMDRGFFGINTFVGKNYIDSLSEKGAVLTMTPASDYKGLKVIDSVGNAVGKVKEVRLNGKTNDITAIVVGRGMTNNDVVFSKSDVHSVGEKIMLNKVFDAHEVKVGGKSK